MINQISTSSAEQAAQTNAQMLSLAQQKMQGNIIMQVIEGSVIELPPPPPPKEKTAETKESTTSNSTTTTASTEESSEGTATGEAQTAPAAQASKEPQHPSSVTKEQLQSPIDIRI